MEQSEKPSRGFALLWIGLSTAMAYIAYLCFDGAYSFYMRDAPRDNTITAIGYGIAATIIAGLLGYLAISDTRERLNT
jgi:hypothetical protein